MLSDLQFSRTRRLALSLAGIELCDRHREVLARRTQRLDLAGDGRLDALLDEAEHGEAVAARQLVGLLTTKWTGFFRHPEHFEIAATHALRVARHRGRARLWSAAAATGEEPYSLAMVIAETFQNPDPPVDILATDIDAEALAVAQRGEYGELALLSVTPERREDFFRETSPGRRWSIGPVARQPVEFQSLNLVDADWQAVASFSQARGISFQAEEVFDVIFCRNVLMYLAASYRVAVAERMASLLAADGLLILDPAEHLGQARHLFTGEGGGIYAVRAKRVSETAAVVS